MRANKIATATMLVLAVSGWGVAGSTTAFADKGPAHDGKAKAADKGPAHGKARARAEGGSSTGADLFQQNFAQSARQNNNCNNPNTGGVFGPRAVTLTDSRATGRCVTTDGSLTALSRVHNGPAHAQGGSSTASVVQQNIAQRGRQNNSCNNVNESSITLDSSRVEGRCTDQDISLSTHSRIKGGGARAEGGSNAAVPMIQQNVAQEGRQNNNCNNPDDANLALTDGSQVLRCGNKDGSLNKYTRIKGGGARAEGGSSAASFVEQQNVAQEGRQNNTCNNRNLSSLTGGQERSRCGNKDFSFSKHTRIKGGGARAEGGSGTLSDVNQQNIAQEGRQNNTCNNPNNSPVTVEGGSRETSHCRNKDTSFSKHTRIKGGGARAQGGSANSVDQQNIAQEGRQNNTCNNTNAALTNTLAGSQETSHCRTKDASFSKHTRIKGGGARAQGGSATGEGADVNQQNIAQEGRQNNICSNPNVPFVDLTETRVEGRCADQDFSFSKHTHIKGGGARADGGSANSLIQQNIAQEGRQNNTCSNTNDELFAIVVTEGRREGRCGNKDHSFSKHTYSKGGGARANGGSATAALSQQNIAQEGRQNNTCGNTNAGTDIRLTRSRLDSHCGNKDHSFSKHTVNKGGGARAQGGSASNVNQQNMAQEGRQNNNCSNPNDSFISIIDARFVSRCGNKDHSFSKHTVNKSGGAEANGGRGPTVARQRNVAQEGRQNNNCSNLNRSFFDDLNRGQVDDRCGNKDRSYSKKVMVKNGGAKANGGSATAIALEQQNIAQEGRQNNTCASPNSTDFVLEDVQVKNRCGNKDHSYSKKVLVKSGGTRVEGGSSTAGNANQQNIAQEGRQNNACANLNDATEFSVTRSRLDRTCHNKDHSFSKKVLVKSGGARVEGGSGTGLLNQQNIAQEGRQNNACANLNQSPFVVTDNRLDRNCGNKDRSFSKKVLVKSGGARVEGGSSTGGAVVQQNIAQEGRQNNACANFNNSPITATEGRLESRCKTTDESENLGTKKVTGGARAEGGSSTGATVSQQNIAQEGRQNNACDNPNETDITGNGGRSRVGCKTLDHSANLGTAEIGGGAQAEGGSSTAGLFQQNIAQEGRQDNACANPNNLTLSTTGSSTTHTHCTAIDHSTNIRTTNR
ncbi:hypothetical protein [Streptomyces sp. NPDC051776]|uniref:hypothetical protein n=1 Tax=Streptomyces sp. NPDC051776 TaxID=3155414 RepID=UPI003422CE13